MKYNEFRTLFCDRVTFSLRDIRKYDADFDQRRISEWTDKGYIESVIRGHYRFCDTELDENDLFLISNKLAIQSYISLESALSYYELIPEAVFRITAVSSNKKIDFDTKIGYFSYNKIRPSMFFGYKLIRPEKDEIKIAEPEKAIIDYLYFNPSLNSIESFREMRIDTAGAKIIISRSKINQYLRLINIRALSRRVKLLIKYIYDD